MLASYEMPRMQARHEAKTKRCYLQMKSAHKVFFLINRYFYEKSIIIGIYT